MIIKIFALRDLKADSFMQPFYYPTVGQALRGVFDLATDMATLVARHPEDFVLFELGEWEDQSAGFSVGVPVHVAGVTSILEMGRRNGETQQ